MGQKGVNTNEIYVFSGGDYISSGTIVDGWHPSPAGWNSVSSIMEEVRRANRIHGTIKTRGVGETQVIEVRQDGKFFEETRTATMTEYGLRLD